VDSNRGLDARAEEPRNPAGAGVCRYGTLLDDLPLGVVEIDRDGIMQFANTAFCRLFGISKGEAGGTNISDLCTLQESPGDSSFQLEGVPEKQPPPRPFGLKVKTRDTRFLDIQVYWNYVRDNRAAVVGYLAVIANVTLQRQAEEALSKSEQLYHTFAENMPGIVFLSRMDFTPIIFDGEVERITGYARHEFLSGKPRWDQIAWPEDRVALSESLEALATVPGHSTNCEHRIVRKNGEVRRVRIATRNLCDASGRPTLMQGVIQDISAVAAGDPSERRYQELVDSVMEGIGIVDKDEIIRYANPAFARIFDEDAAEAIIGKNLIDYLPESQQNLVFSQSGWRRKGKSSQYELEIVSAKGRKKYVYVCITPRFDDGNEYTGAIGSVLDITETRTLQEFVSRAQRLEIAGRIAGQVAHDFNNLLGPLVAYPDMIRCELSENHPAMSMLDDMQKAAEQMADINQQLLTLSRRGHYVQETFCLNETVRQALAQMPGLPETLRIETDLDAGLMNTRGGSAQILRVILNLLSNARDAVRDNGTVRIRTENYYADQVTLKYGRIPKGEYVKVTISDTGCGILKEQLSRIFEPFFTTKTTDRQRGSGLGLSVVHAVMEDHNGFVDLSSTPGDGTSFFLYFPIARETGEIQRSDEISGGSESILVVDDDTTQREVAQKLLGKLGYIVTATESGEKAVEFLKCTPHDLLVLDMIMPDGMDGAETYRKALEINPFQKAVVVSGYAETDRIDMALKLGAGAYLRKPLTLKALAVSVRKELDRVPM
jgi:PAS domain S-box-containing protein